MAAVARMGAATGMDEQAPPPLCKIPFMWRWARETMRGKVWDLGGEKGVLPLLPSGLCQAGWWGFAVAVSSL